MRSNVRYDLMEAQGATFMVEGTKAKLNNIRVNLEQALRSCNKSLERLSLDDINRLKAAVEMAAKQAKGL